MDDTIAVRFAGKNDYEIVGTLAWELLNELYPKSPDPFDKSKFVATAKQLLSEGTRFWSLLAESGNEVAAALCLNECAAIYSGGSFGEITEFYVKPAFRSKGVGALLMRAARNFCIEKGWQVLEVGAPPPEVWQRSMDFYLDHGFSPIGPRLETTIKPL